MRKFKKLLACLSLFMMMAFSSSAYLTATATIVSFPSEGNPCWTVHVQINWVAPDGQVTYVASGNAKICRDGRDSTVPDTDGNNPDCPPIVVNGNTYKTDRESTKCLGEILEDTDAVEIVENAINSVIEPKTAQRSSPSGFWTPPVLNVTDENTTFKVYPNPLLKGKSVRVTSPKLSGGARVVVYDNMGKLVSNIDIEIGSSAVDIDIPNAAGVYLIMLKSGDKVLYREKVIKQ